MRCAARINASYLFFLTNVNDMTMTVKCNRFLYADDKCLVFQRENVKDIENQLNEKILQTYAISLFQLN